MSLPLLRSTTLDIVYYHTQSRSRIKMGFADRPILESPLLALMVAVLDRCWAMQHHVGATRHHRGYRAPPFTATPAAWAARGPRHRPYSWP